MASKLVNTPIVQLKQYAQTGQGHEYSQIVKELFDLPVQID